jgi:hypothetical protein
MRAFFKGLIGWVSSFAGSRVLIAVSGLFVVAFLAHSVALPNRLPPVGFFNLTALGLAPAAPTYVAPNLPGLDRLDAETRAKIETTLREQAVKQGVKLRSRAENEARAYLATHGETVRTLNMIGFLVSMIALVASIAIHAGSIATQERRARRAAI